MRETHLKTWKSYLGFQCSVISWLWVFKSRIVNVMQKVFVIAMPFAWNLWVEAFGTNSELEHYSTNRFTAWLLHCGFKCVKYARNKFPWCDFRSFSKEFSAYLHHFRFRFLCTSHSKLVKLLQTQVWPLNFTNFSNVIFGGFLQFGTTVRWICCRSNLGKFLDINAQLFTNEEWMSVCFYIHAGCHRGYRWIIMWQKFWDIGLNGFIFEKMNKNCNIEERKNPGGRLRLAC